VCLREYLETLDVTPKAVAPALEIRRQILFFAHRYARPFYLGQLANDIEWSLERTEQYVQHLVTEGLIKKLSPQEAQGFSHIKTLHLYVVAGNLNAQAAHHV
jgi:hypothetical protein